MTGTLRLSVVCSNPVSPSFPWHFHKVPSTTLCSLQLWPESDLATTCTGSDLTGERCPLRISVVPYLIDTHQVFRVTSYSRKESRERGSAVAKESSLTTRTSLLSSWPCLVAWVTVLCGGQDSPARAPVWPFSASRSFCKQTIWMVPLSHTLPQSHPECMTSNSSCKLAHLKCVQTWAC